MLINGKQIRDGSITAAKLAGGITDTKPTNANKAMAALLTTGDNQLATSGSVTYTPAPSSYVSVLVNGTGQVVGDGIKTKDCYFSSDGGSTALAFSGALSGSLLYWNGSISGFQLGTTDLIDFDYDV